MAEAAASNPQFRRYWNEEGGADWRQHRRRFDDMFRPLHDEVLRVLEPRPGERILDVGCGPGELTRAIADRVAPDGEAVGVDLSVALVELARADAERTSSPAHFLLADAQEVDLGPLGPLDAWTSRLGVMFFDDAPRAFTNLCQALRPGGRVVCSCWAPFPENPWMAVPMGALMGALMGSLPAAPPTAPGSSPGVDPWAFGEHDRLVALLEPLPLDELEVRPFDFDITLAGGGSPGAVVDWLCSLDAVTPTLRAAPAAAVAAGRAAATEALRPYEQAGRVVVPGRAQIVTARRA